MFHNFFAYGEPNPVTFVCLLVVQALKEFKDSFLLVLWYSNTIVLDSKKPFFMATLLSRDVDAGWFWTSKLNRITNEIL